MTRQKILKWSLLARAICESGVAFFCDFWTYKAPYLRNGARYNQSYYWTLIGNYMRAFDWYQDQRPWMTLNWPWAAITHFFTLHICLSKPTTKIRMNIDPYNQQQKCTPKIVVSSSIRLMWTFAGVCWTGSFKWEWGRWKRWFSLISTAISSEPSHLWPKLLYYAM